MKNGRKIAAGACAALMLVAGCGGAASKLAEKATGCKNIDAGNGKVECNGQKIDVSGNASLPDGFPKELAPPKGTKIYSSFTNTDSGNKSWTITASLKGSVDSVSKGLKKQLKDAGYKIVNDSVSSGSSGASGSISAQNDKYSVSASFGENTVNPKDAGVYITMNVSELTKEQKDAASSSAADSSSADSSAADTSSADTGSSSSADSGSTTGGSSTTSGETLPEGFPKELAPPSGAKIVSGVKTTTGGKDEYLVQAGLSGSVKDVYDAIKKQVKDAGYTIVADQITTSGSDSYGTLQATKGSTTVNVVVSPDSSGSSGKPVSVTMSVEKG